MADQLGATHLGPGLSALVAVRRLYLFIVSAASLGMVLWGLASLGGAAIDLAFVGLVLGPTFREELARAAAVTLIGLPVWGLHWSAAQRIARRDAPERASALRRLYLYGVAAALAIAAGILGSHFLRLLFAPLEFAGRAEPAATLGAAWQVILVSAALAYHASVAAGDREAVGERGASATLRRWYLYGVQLIGLVIALWGARDLLAGLAQAPGGLVAFGGVSATGGSALAWTAVWAAHTWRADRNLEAAEDRVSTLRTGQGFLVVALAVLLVLSNASRALYFLLARALGVPAPGGIVTFDLGILAQPLSTIVVFGAAWAIVRHRLRVDVAAAEAPRQAGVRRLYAHLVALAALAALSVGVAGLLSTVLELALGALGPGAQWRDQVSRSLTLVGVGLPIWLLHWRAGPDRAARMAFSRRLYVFAVLAVSVLALLGAGAVLVSILLNALLGGEPAELLARTSGPTSAILVAAAVGAYHWQVLGRDSRERAAAEPGPQPAEATAVIVAEIAGASEAEVRQALAALPPGASYRLRG